MGGFVRKWGRGLPPWELGLWAQQGSEKGERENKVPGKFC